MLPTHCPGECQVDGIPVSSLPFPLHLCAKLSIRSQPSFKNHVFPGDPMSFVKFLSSLIWGTEIQQSDQCDKEYTF